MKGRIPPKDAGFRILLLSLPCHVGDDLLLIAPLSEVSQLHRKMSGHVDGDLALVRNRKIGLRGTKCIIEQMG
jgi:hypothetical protein